MRTMFILVALAACGTDTPEPEEVRSRITTDLAHVLAEAEASIDQTGEAMPSGLAFDALDRIAGSGDATGTFLPRIANHLTGALVAQPDRNAKPADVVDGDATEISERLANELFADANHLGDGLYRVPATLACEADDADCAAKLERVRVRVGEDNDALVFTVEVDAHAPLRFVLAHESLAATVDLDAAANALAALGEAPVSLSGEVTGALHVLGPAAVRFATTIDRPIRIAIDGLELASAIANVFQLELDGATRSAAAMIALGETRIAIADEESFELDLPGLTAIAMMTPSQPLQLTNVGLGTRTTTLSIDGRRALAIDVNPDDGRTFAASLGRSDDRETLQTSLIDLRFAVEHAGERPVYDVTQLLVSGALATDGSQIEVTSGRLSVTTNPTDYGFTATAGQCAFATEVEDVTTGRFYDQWSAGSCN